MPPTRNTEALNFHIRARISPITYHCQYCATVMKGFKYSFLSWLPLLLIAQAAYTSPGLSARSTESSSSNDTRLVVDLGYAKYQGVFNETSSSVRFLGLRYAKSTAGSSRWKAPQTPDGTAGLQIANTQPAECPQAPFGSAAGSPFRNSSSGIQKRDQVFTENEDCLFLNVYVPGSQFNTPTPEDLPVIIWIHGGGYHFGSAANSALPDTTGGYDGEDILRIGDGRAIVVVIQYRLGIFGFLAGDKVATGGDLNVGLLDQQFALQWVQQHISKFTGDPSHIVIWGESAGELHLDLHGLWLLLNRRFLKALDPEPFRAQCFFLRFTTMMIQYLRWVTMNSTLASTWHDAKSRKSPAESKELLGIYFGFPAIQKIYNLQSTPRWLIKPNLSVLSAANNQIALDGFFGTFIYSPVIDGTFMTQRPTELLAQGKINKVEKILAITNAFEGTIFTDPNTTDVVEVVQNYFPTVSEDTAAETARLYANANPAMSPFEIAVQIVGEWELICPTYSLLEAFPSSSYKGEFAIPPAFHGDDLFYYFTSLSRPSPPVFRNADFDEAFAQTFLAFATSDDLDPNDKFDETIVPEWPLWSLNNAMEMLFNRTEDFEPLIKAMNTDEGLLDRCFGGMSLQKPINRSGMYMDPSPGKTLLLLSVVFRSTFWILNMYAQIILKFQSPQFDSPLLTPFKLDGTPRDLLAHLPSSPSHL
ncbi:hypothetical protein D9758_012820 [Tetrapyrgos nigripes]|uniref:Carboxylesterase type B domain-containing protein n=1 Tax=Tetrapyrgos nigripes TaxID=182062 RepID=A0A8H5D1A3_9AGAR|nr:hypothetical protein D9758_012820 [Tetrapyrgos nigripes]